MALAAPPRVLIDTNTLISAVYRALREGLGGCRRLRDSQLPLPGFRFPGNPGRILEAALEGRINLVLPYVVIAEARAVVRRKFPRRTMSALNHFLKLIPFETVALPKKRELRVHEGRIADPFDLPLLVSAITAKADYVVSGDRHFHSPAVRSILPVVSARKLVEQLGL